MLEWDSGAIPSFPLLVTGLRPSDSLFEYEFKFTSELLLRPESAEDSTV